MTDRENTQQTETWQVHVYGPDDLLPASSRADAMQQAHDINSATLGYSTDFLNDPLTPTVWAVPERVTCTCGSPDAYSLNPAEVLVHRPDAPCFIARADREKPQR